MKGIPEAKLPLMNTYPRETLCCRKRLAEHLNDVKNKKQKRNRKYYQTLVLVMSRYKLTEYMAIHRLVLKEKYEKNTPNTLSIIQQSQTCLCVHMFFSFFFDVFMVYAVNTLKCTTWSSIGRKFG